MHRRELLKGAALSSLVGTLLAPSITLAAQDRADSEAAKALAELQQALDDLELAFASPEWKLRTPQDYAEARRVMLHALMHGLHIRADFIYRNFEVKTQGRVDLVLYIFLFMPAMLFLLKAGYDFALKSVLQGERAGDSTWAPVVWPVKVSLAVGVALLLVQGVSEILKSWYAATRGRWPS